MSLGAKFKYALTFMILVITVMIFSVFSVLAAANITVKNSIELNFIPCYTLLNGTQFNSRIPGTCTRIVFDKLTDEDDNVKPEYVNIETNSIYTTTVTQDGSPNVNLYYVDTTAYILSNKKIIFSRNCYNMFYYLNMVENITFNNIDTSQVQNMSAMFANCSNLNELDLSNFSTANVENFSAMFFKCSKIQTLDVSSFNTSKAENLNDMFSCCVNLKTIDLSLFNTSNVKKMAQMFFNCYNLESVNLSNFSTLEVEDLTSMFYGCSKLNEIDLSSFNTVKLKKTAQMFCDCIALRKVIVGLNWVVDSVQISNSSNMFYNCINLKFGNGTSYDSSKIDINYAVVGDNGYLTLKTV